MAADYDVLIVDDDPIQANLLRETLGDLGFSARVLPDGSRVIEEAGRAKPRLVIMDVIMPGIDGLSLCMKLQPLLSGWGANVVIASGKDRRREEPRALKAGAAAFLQKPFRLSDLRRELDKLLGPPGISPAAPSTVLAVRYWGTRGPGPKATPASVFGSRGPCVSIGLASGEIYVFDAGTGIRPCAQALAAAQATSATLLLTHYHASHVEGLKGLALLGKPGFSLRIMGPLDPETNLAEFCGGLGAKATLQPFTLEEKSYRLGNDVRLSAIYTNHPSTTLAFAFETASRKIVYCPDADLPAEGEVEVGNSLERLRGFAQGADLLVFDSHFLPEDVAAGREEGHSSWPAAVRLASAAGVRRLSLFHVSNRYPDAKLIEMDGAAKRALASGPSSIQVGIAKEGQTFEL